MKRFLLLLLFLTSLYSLFAQKGEAIVKTAMDYKGTPYVTGGTSKDGVDCSGLTQNIYFENGIKLGRTVSAQAKAGTAVTADNLKPGDLVFFATGSSPTNPTHVAVYIGENSIIHAISQGPKKGVNISKLSEAYWNPKILYYRRVFEENTPTEGVDTENIVTDAEGSSSGKEAVTVEKLGESTSVLSKETFDPETFIIETSEKEYPLF